MNKKIFESILIDLETKRTQETFRVPSLKPKNVLCDLSSNDYFCLKNDERLISASIDALKKYGAGTGASKYLFGYSDLHFELERKTAKLKNFSSCVLFGSGYLANVGVICALASFVDLILADKKIHASMIDGAVVSRTKMIRFFHNDLNHLEDLLDKNKDKKILILTEETFSMDGTKIEREEYVFLARKYGSILLIDCAHSLFQKNEKPSYELLCEIGTFSKAVGSYGGYFVGTKDLCDFVQNFAKSQIYSTSLPSSVVGASICGIDIILQMKEDDLLTPHRFGIEMGFKSHIGLIQFKTNQEAFAVHSRLLNEKGILTSFVRKPTVLMPSIRLSFSSSPVVLEMFDAICCLNIS